MILPRSFYERDTREVAPELLNKVLTMKDGRSGRIVEVEAYCGGEDPAAHSFRGRTLRNATMFGPPGHLYVYFSYGVHWCANAVAWRVQPGGGILIRALEPLTGLDAMRRARSLDSVRLLCKGPGRLAQALGINKRHDGADLVAGDEVQIVDDGVAPPPLSASRRVGISKAVEQEWRWTVAGSPFLSKR